MQPRINHHHMAAAPPVEYPIGAQVTLGPETAVRNSIERGYHHPLMFKLQGVPGNIMRYTGVGVAFVRFKCPGFVNVSFSLPTRCLIPAEGVEPLAPGTLMSSNSFGSSSPTTPLRTAKPGTPTSPSPQQMCVVCGRSDRKGETRVSGFKCKECVGRKSSANLKALAASKK
eukprot:PhF_6_TR40424/c0_g1_i1/m.60266